LSGANFSDVLFATLLMISVPFLVNHYLKGLFFTNQFRQLVTWGGIFWLMFAFLKGAAIFCHGSSGLEQLLIVDFC